MRPSVPDVHITDSQDAELAEYRPLSGLAIVALIFGLLSPLALASDILWAIIPAAGILFGWSALRRIRVAKPAMIGRTTALVGIALSLVFLAIPPARQLVYEKMVRDEARQFANLWFQHLARGEPQKAMELILSPDARRPLDWRLWKFYRNDPEMKKKLQGFVATPVVRTLLALGPAAQVRFFQTGMQGEIEDGDGVELWYAVTFEEEKEKRSFFVRLDTRRVPLRDEVNAGWYIANCGVGDKPKGW